MTDHPISTPSAPVGQRVRLVEYTPDLFQALQRTAVRLGVSTLCHRSFVDYYYSENPWSRLHLLMTDTDTVAGTIGIDRMQFRAGERSLDLAFATNYHAAQPGAGGYLYLHWMKTSS